MIHKEMAIKNLALALGMLNDPKKATWTPPGGRTNIIKLLSSATRYVEGLDRNLPDFSGLGNYMLDSEPSFKDPKALLIFEANESFDEFRKNTQRNENFPKAS